MHLMLPERHDGGGSLRSLRRARSAVTRLAIKPDSIEMLPGSDEFGPGVHRCETVCEWNDRSVH